MATTRPNIASIAPNLPFLDVLARWWLERAGADALRAADGLFILPTRRAARGLSEAFLRAADGRALLLPRIMALGAVDEAPLALADSLVLPPAVPAKIRLASLARLILAMDGANGAPRSADRAWVLAEELATLLDEAARAEIDLERALPNAAGGDFAAHWNVTLHFLQIITHRWPEFLAEAGYCDVAMRQIALLDAQTLAWQHAPPGMPVIAAGTTGAIPAVARLLRVIAHLPEGLVVLPGLDQALDDESFAALHESHPQAALRHLLSALAVQRGDVTDFANISGEAAHSCGVGRIATLRSAMLPAPFLSAWQNQVSPDISGLWRLDAAHQQEEAQAIALVLRDAVQTPGQRAALVTPDRALAQLVAAELLRFDIVADDSAGEPLAETPPAAFIRLIANAVAESLRPVPLLSMLKHPLCAAGFSRAVCLEAARRLERACLRGARPAPWFAGLRAAGADADFLAAMERSLQHLQRIMALDRVAADEALTALMAAAEAMAATDVASGAVLLWAGEDGEALAQHLADLTEALAVLPPIEPASLPALLDASFSGQAVRSRRALRGRDGSEHPRVAIWGLLEARLQHADVLVLGGLCEASWPPLADSGPWMNRAMRAAVGLPSPEERIGLAAHDFVMATCAAPTVVLSASRRRDGAPSVPSRWLVRMDAFLAGQGMALAAHPAAVWAGALDHPVGPPAPVSPPAPAPAVALRPRRLSVTDIETWLRDPYAIYARHVLRLTRLDPLEQSADAADYGTIVHAGLHRFFQRFGLTWPADAAEQLVLCMDAALGEAAMRPALAAWWRPRLRRIAAWVANEEAMRRATQPAKLLRSEVAGVWVFDAPAGPFTLQGRADRIERRADSTLAILDYKTGKAPSGRELEEGRAPQLPLEAAMARQGAFGAELAGEVSELIFWQISGGYTPGRVQALFKNHAEQAEKTASVAERAHTSLMALVADFDDPARAYLSQPTPGAAPRFSDYAQLARVAEWAVMERPEEE